MTRLGLETPIILRTIFICYKITNLLDVIITTCLQTRIPTIQCICVCVCVCMFVCMYVGMYIYNSGKVFITQTLDSGLNIYKHINNN